MLGFSETERKDTKRERMGRGWIDENGWLWLTDVPNYPRRKNELSFVIFFKIIIFYYFFIILIKILDMLKSVFCRVLKQRAMVVVAYPIQSVKGKVVIESALLLDSN